MNDKILFQKIINRNNHINMSLNDRYKKRNLILINSRNSTNSNTLSTYSTLKKIEDLKRKYNHMNFQQKMNLKNNYINIIKLKKKYFSKDKEKENNNNINLITREENSARNNKSLTKFSIQSTDKLSLINKTFDKNSNFNTYLNTVDNEIMNNFDKNILRKSNEINYQVKSKINNLNKNKMINLNLKILKNNSEQNNKTIREEFLKFGKSIKKILDENDINENNKNELDENHNQRTKSVCPIKKRINILSSVKNQIKKINKDLFKENEKNNNTNISVDSQSDLEFKHIKPMIMNENYIKENYFKEEQKDKYANDSLLKPILIRSLPRPKLNIPKYPTFFHKFSKM